MQPQANTVASTPALKEQVRQHSLYQKDLPQQLYRVVLFDTQTSFNGTDGLRAGGDGTEKDADLTTIASSHLNWQSRTQKSPFISFFGNVEQAMEWGEHVVHTRYRWTAAGALLVQLDTDRLPAAATGTQTQIFRASDVVSGSLNHNRAHREEYLAFEHVPASALKVVASLVQRGDHGWMWGPETSTPSGQRFSFEQL